MEINVNHIRQCIILWSPDTVDSPNYIINMQPLAQKQIFHSIKNVAI